MVHRADQSMTYPEVLAAKVASGKASPGERALHGEDVVGAALLLHEFLFVLCFSCSLLARYA